MRVDGDVLQRRCKAQGFRFRVRGSMVGAPRKTRKRREFLIIIRLPSAATFLKRKASRFAFTSFLWKEGDHASGGGWSCTTLNQAHSLSQPPPFGPSPFQRKGASLSLIISFSQISSPLPSSLKRVPVRAGDDFQTLRRFIIFCAAPPLLTPHF